MRTSYFSSTIRGNMNTESGVTLQPKALAKPTPKITGLVPTNAEQFLPRHLPPPHPGDYSKN